MFLRILSFAGKGSFLSFLELAELVVQIAVMVLLFLLLPGLEGAHEVLEAFPRPHGLLFLCLGFLDGADCVLHRPVGSLDDVPGFLVRLVEDFLLGLLYVLKFLLVAFCDAFQGLVSVLDLLELIFESLAVTDNLTKVSLDVHELFSGTVFRILDDVLRKTHLPCQFECERVARKTDFKGEQRLDPCRIELHRSVDDSGLGPGSVELEVGVVGGDDSVDPFSVQFAENRFGDGPSRGRLGARAEFIDQHQSPGIRLAQHRLHVLEEGTVGAQVVFDVLVVADADHDPVEDRKLRRFRCRDQHSPLEHVLEQSCGLQADRFSAGIRSGDEEDVLGRVEFHRHRDDLFAFACESFLQKGMPCFPEIHLPVFGNHRHTCLEVQRDLSLCHQEVGFTDIFGSKEQVGNMRTHEVAEIREYPVDLLGFLYPQVGDFVVDFNEFRRLYEGRLAGCGGVVDKARDFPFRGTVDRNQQFAVSNRDCRILAGNSAGLCLTQNVRGHFRDCAFLGLDGLPDPEQLVGRRVFEISELVEDGVYLPLDFGEADHF